MMSLTEDQYEMIRPLLPVQRGNVRIAHLDVINAVLYVAENGCKWRALPARFGNWHTVYTRCVVGRRRVCWIGCSKPCKNIA